MCTIESLKKDFNQKNGFLKNRQVEKTNLREALELLDEAPKSKFVQKNGSGNSEIDEMAAMIEATLDEGNSKKFTSIKNEVPKDMKHVKTVPNSAMKNAEISKDTRPVRMTLSPAMKTNEILNNAKHVRTIEDKIQKKDFDPKPAEIARKRFLEPSSPQNLLDAKKARIQQALSASHRPMEKKNIGINGPNGKPSYIHPVRNSKPLPVHAEPITVKPVPQSTLAGGRSTIHGRKTMSIREQQEKISRKNISELVIRLKAENEIEKKFQKPVARSVKDNSGKKNTHAAAFGALQSVSRLPFELDNGEKLNHCDSLRLDDGKKPVPRLSSKLPGDNASISRVMT
ncbi:hypothetical protein FO519_002651 [Halicephalobus sp. NKZ332]|nr:hypothetical protein FO519_002651 [Halicephalobus sp. NKZ332]